MSKYLSSTANLKAGSSGLLKDLQFSDNFADLAVFDFGNLTNLRDDVQNPQTSLTLEVLVLVVNAAENVQDTLLAAAASFGQSRRASAYRNLLSEIAVQEPNMLLDIQIVDGAAKVRDAGDQVPLQLTVKHVRDLSSNVSHSPSFAITVQEFFNAQLLLQAGSPTLSANYPVQQGVNTITSGMKAGDTTAIVSISQMLLTSDASADLSIDLTAFPSNVAVTGDYVYDHASLVYYSSPPYNGVQHGRSYTTTADVSFFIKDTSSLTHSLASKSVQQIPTSQTSVGETLTWNVTLQLPEGLTTSVLVEDDIAPAEYRDARLKLVSASVSFIGKSISSTTGLTLGSLGVVSDESFNDGIEDYVYFDFGNVTNFFDNVVDANDEIVMSITAVVLDMDNNAQNVPVGAAANFSRPGFTTDYIEVVTPAITIQEPLLTLDVQIVGQNTTVWYGGQNVPIVIKVQHTKNATPQSHSGAFSVRVTDLFGNGLYLVPGSVNVSSNYPILPGINSITSGDGASDTAMIVDILYMPLVADSSADLTISVTATIIKDVLIVSGVDNLVDLQYFTVPNGGLIPGRNYSASQLDSIFVHDTSYFHHYISSKTIPQLSTSSASIGEFLTIHIDVSLPAGMMQGVTLSEDVAPPEYQQGRLQIVSSNITFMSKYLSSTANLKAGSSGVLKDLQFSDNITDLVVFDFGNLTNLRDDVQNPQTSLTLEVLVLVVNVNQNVQDIQLSAASEFGQAPYRSLLSPLSIQEPNVTVSIQIPNGASIDRCGGDKMPFTITVAHLRTPSPSVSHSPAFMLNVDDPFNPDLLLKSGSVSLSSNYPAGGVATITKGNNGPDSSAVVDLTSFALAVDNSADLVIQLQATVSPLVLIGVAVHNPVYITYYSSPPYNGQQHGRLYTASVDVSFPIRDSSILVQYLVGTSLPYTPEGPPTYVNVGEKVTYTSHLTIPAGVLADVQIVHDLAPPEQPGKWRLDTASLELGSRVSSNAGIVTGSSPVVSLDPNGMGNKVTWHLGNLTTAPEANTVYSTDGITFTYTVLVLNDPTNELNTMFTATSEFTRRSGPKRRLLVPDVTLIVPVLQLTKSETVSLGDSGDIITFTFLIAHTQDSTSVAFNVKLTDPGHPMLLLQPGSLKIVNALSSNVFSGNASGDTGIDILISEMPIAAGPVVVSYTCFVSPLAEINTAITTQGNLQYTSAIDPLLSRLDTTPSNPVSFLMSDVVLESFTVVSTLLGPNGKVASSPSSAPGIVVGETAILRTVVSFPEGTTVDTYMALEIPAGLQAVSAVVTSLGGMTSSLLSVNSTGSISPGLVEFVFGTISNPPDGVVTPNDQLITQVVVQAVDQPTLVTNYADLLPNVSLSYQHITNGTKELSAAVETVEPHLLIQLIGNVSSTGLDEIDYTIRVWTAPDCTATAFGVSIENLIADTALTLVAGSVTTTAGNIVLGNNPNDTTVKITLDQVLPNAADIIITFKTLVDEVFDPATPISITADIAYNSLPAIKGTGRSYSGTSTFSTPLDWPQFNSFSIIATSVSETAYNTSYADLAIGESVVFRMAFTLPSHIKQEAPITAIISTNPAFVGSNAKLKVTAAEVYYITPGAHTLLNVGDPGAIVDTLGDGNGDAAVFNFGVPTYDSLTNDNYEFQVKVYAVVLDVPQNVRGQTFICTSTLDYQVHKKQRQTSLTIVEPSLSIDTYLNGTTGDAGDAFIVATTINHLPRSTSAAFNVDVSFFFTSWMDGPLNLVVFPASVPVQTTITTGSNGYPRLTVTVPAFLLPTKTIQISFLIKEIDLVEPVLIMPGSVSLQYESIPYTGLGGRLNTEVESPSNYTRNWTIMVPPPSVSLTLVGTSQPFTTKRNVTIFEEASFIVRAIIPEGISRHVDLVSVISQYLNYSDVPANSMAIKTSSPGELLCNADADGTNGQPCELVDVGSLLNLHSKLVNNLDELKEISLPLGNVVNLNRNNAITDWIELHYVTEVQDCPRRSNLTNTPYMLWTSPQDALTTLITENEKQQLLSHKPQLSITQAVNITSVKDKTKILVTMTIYHVTESDVEAWNIVMSNVLPSGIEYIPDTYRFVSGLEPDAFQTFLDAENITFTSPPPVLSATPSVLAWRIPMLPLHNHTVVEFVVLVNLARVNRSSDVLTFHPSVAWSSIPDGGRLWVDVYQGGLPGELNATSILWEGNPTGNSLCIGGLLVAGAALTAGYRGGAYANDGWLLVDHFQFVAISAALGIDWLDVWCGHYLGWSSCFSWTLLEVPVPWDLLGKEFHFLFDAGYAFKSSSKTTEPDGQVFHTRSVTIEQEPQQQQQEQQQEQQTQTRMMEDYSYTIALPMADFVVSFVFYFCIVFVVLTITFLILLIVSKVVDCMYFGFGGKTGYAGHHGPHGAEQSASVNIQESGDIARELTVTGLHSIHQRNPLYDEPDFMFYKYPTDPSLGRAEEEETKEGMKVLSTWLPWFLNSLMLLSASGLVRLATLAYLPATICGFLTLYLISGGWSVPPINALMGILCILMVLLLPILFFVFWLTVIKMKKVRWFYRPDRARVIRHVMGSLYADYQERYAWFHLVIMARKLLVGAAVGLLWQIPAALIIIVLIVYLIYIVVLIAVRPYNHNKWSHNWGMFLPGCGDHRVKLKWSYWTELWTLLGIPIVLFIEMVVYFAGGNSGVACLLMIWVHIIIFVVFFFLTTPAWIYYLYRLVAAGCGCVDKSTDDRLHHKAENNTTPNPFFVTSNSFLDGDSLRRRPGDPGPNDDDIHEGDTDEDAHAAVDDNPPAPVYKKRGSLPSLFGSKPSKQDEQEMEVLTPRTLSEFNRYKDMAARRGSGGKKKSVTMAVDPQTGEMRKASLFDSEKVKQVYGQLSSSDDEDNEEGEEHEEKGKEKEGGKKNRIETKKGRYRKELANPFFVPIPEEEEEGGEKEPKHKPHQVERKTGSGSGPKSAVEVDFGEMQMKQAQNLPPSKLRITTSPRNKDVGATDIQDSDL